MPSSDVDSGMAWEDEPEQESSGSAIASDDVLGYMRAIAGDVEDLSGSSAGARSTRRDGVQRVLRQLDGHMAPVDRELAEESGRPQVLIATSILLDGRTVYGPPELDPRAILLEPETRGALLAPMLRLAQALKLPTGFKGKIVVEDSGEHRGTFDIKKADCSRSSTSPASGH